MKRKNEKEPFSEYFQNDDKQQKYADVKEKVLESIVDELNYKKIKTRKIDVIE